MEIGKKTNHSSPGIHDTPWIPEVGIPLRVLFFCVPSSMFCTPEFLFQRFCFLALYIPMFYFFVSCFLYSRDLHSRVMNSYALFSRVCITVFPIAVLCISVFSFQCSVLLILLFQCSTTYFLQLFLCSEFGLP